MLIDYHVPHLPLSTFSSCKSGCASFEAVLPLIVT
jgi:hypothetical protein